MRSPGRFGLRAGLLAASLVTCTSDHPTGPGRFGRGYLAFRPVVTSPVDLAAFGLTIDSIRVVAVRPVADTALDTTAYFNPDSATLHLALPLLLHAAVDTFVLHLELRAGSVILFTGVDTVGVSSGPPDSSSVPAVAMQYTGPGSGLTSLHLAPRDSVVTLNGTGQFRATADSSGVPVTSFYVSWSTSNAGLATINGAGLLTAPNLRGFVFVRGVTPNGVRDSTRVTFVPVAAAVGAAAGSGQTGTVGTRLPLPLVALVKASDSLGVQGVAVRFQAVSAGSVRDSIVFTDSLGFADDTATLDTIAGAKSYRATVGALTATFSATATPAAISPARSLVTVSVPTVASGAGVTLTLRGKDQFGNSLTTGGATVVFDTTGGTSTGSIGPVTDHGDGTYTATFTGLVVGTATTIGATINGTAVTTALPTISVTAGAISPLTSVVSTSSATVSSGATATLTLQAKDSVGNVLSAGGATVVFSRTGGSSTGSIGATTDHANGTYTAVFTADSAGTATTIRATIGGVLATSTTPITVVPGNTTAARSVITVSADTIQSGGTATLTLQAKDGAGNNITTGGLTVVFSHSGGTSGGTIGATTDHNDGSYTAFFTATTAGTATTIHATINAAQVTSTLPTITVITSGISTTTSVVTSSDSVVATGGQATLTLQAKDGSGNAITTGGATVVFTQSGGTSVGTISATTDHADGSYTATFTGQTAGTPSTIGATINGNAVTSTPLPLIRVFSSVHSSDITADSTWTAAASPHIVNGNIRIRSGATLTIQAGATVKFNAGAALQVGDTSLGETGRLSMDGGAPGIILTANTGTPTPGFWKGIEVQRALSGPAWRRTLIEYGGGTRAPFGGVLSEACVLVVNRSGAALDLDSLRIRQCVHAAIHHFGGTAHVHRSQIDTVTGSGIHVDFGALLELDSTTIRGSGQEGLFFASLTSHLLPSSGNRVLGSAGTGIHLNAFQLPGLLKQDSIVGNGVNFGTNLIEVQGGRPDSTVAAFTIFAQPQPIGSNGYVIRQFGGLLDIGRVGGQAVTLDSNVVLRFEGQTGLRIGDSAGTRSGAIRSLGTNALNRPVLNGAAGTFPGAWVGLEIGRLSGPDTLRFIRIDYAGDSIPNYTRHRAGLYIRNPVAAPFVLDRATIATSGSTGSVANSAGIGIAGSGGTEIRNSVLLQNVGFGIAIQDKAFKIVNDTIQNHTIGIFAYMEGGTQLTAADSIAGNTFPGTQYAWSLTAAALRSLQFNPVTTAASDTLLFTGGLLTADATLPNFPGYVWRATKTTTIDSAATFTLAPGDTVAFDSSAGILVGGVAPAALAADGSAGKILLTANGPLPQGWHGVDFHLMSGSGATTNNVFRHVDVDRAGYYDPCYGECYPIPFGALRFTDSIAPTDVDLSITDLIVRRSNSVALDFQRGGTGTVSVAGSQFYDNKPDPMIQTRYGQGSHLSISGSDLYHYRARVLQSAYRGGAADSVNLVNDWWGDLAGPDTGYFYYPDSLGRASLNQNSALVLPFVSAPFFPVGPATGVVPTRDSLLSSVNLVDSIGIYARVIDANGRGVVGQAVSWTPFPSGASSLSPASSASDFGGRVNAGWKFTNTAGRLTAHAIGGGGFTDYFIDVIPGLTVPPTNWTLLSALSQGTVAGKTITFTSTNRRGVLITNAHDAFGNATPPSSLCFADPNNPSCSYAFPQYGFVDSTHTGGGVGDTMFFHANVTTPSSFVLRASYNIVTGGTVQDSVLITMNAQPAGVKIDRDQYSTGVQGIPDTSVFNALCPSGPPNFYCQRTLQVFVVDSGLTPVASATPTFQWNLVTGSAVTLDSVRGANDLAYVTARSNGIARLAVKDLSVNNYGADTLPLLVNQKAAYIYVTPDTVSVPAGGSTTFRAAVTDIGGDTMPVVPVHWRPDNSVNPHLTITDTTTAHQAIVRLDSTPFGSEYVAAFAVNGPADTAYGYARVINPVLKPINVDVQPWAVAVNSQTHAVYVGHQGGQFYRIDGTTGTATDSTNTGLSVAAVAVNSVTNRVYAATDSGVAVLDGTTLSRVAMVAVGKNDQGVQNRQGLTVDSINNRIYVTVVAPGASPLRVLRRIDGATNTFLPANDVVLPDTGNGAVFNPNDGFVYVTIPDSNLVVAVNPATKTIVKRIAVGGEPFAIALNPFTNRLYVIDQIFTSNYPFNLYVIDAAAGAVVATIPMGFQTASLAVDAVNNRVYVGARYNGYVSVIDGATGFFLGTVNATGFYSDQELGVAFDAANGHVYTANYSSASITRLKY